MSNGIESKECLEEQVFRKEAVHWLWVLLVGMLGIAVFLAGVLFLYSEDVFHVILQAVATRIPIFLLSIFSLLGAILAFERVTPHNYLDIISEDPMACAIVISVFIASVSLVIAYVY
jgi:hypothetical protein